MSFLKDVVDLNMPEIVPEIALYQYYIMTMVSVIALLFYTETYTKPRFSSSDG